MTIEVGVNVIATSPSAFPRGRARTATVTESVLRTGVESMNLATAVAASIDERALITRLAGTVVGGDPRALAGRPVIPLLRNSS
jgi:hypothetical protein